MSTQPNDAKSSDTTTLSIPADDPLVVEIKTEAAKADKKARETVSSFRKLGELLIELKKRVPHGSFMTEVEKLTGIPHRSATRYMAMVSQKPRRSQLTDKPAEAYLRKCIDVKAADRMAKSGQFENSTRTAVTIDAEVVEPEDDPQPLVVDETKNEPLMRAIKRTQPETDHDPLHDAIERLIFVVMNQNCSTDFINALADSVLGTRGKESAINRLIFVVIDQKCSADDINVLADSVIATEGKEGA